MAKVSQKGAFTFNFTDFDEPPKPLTGARFKVLDLPPSIPRPEGMAISEYVMTFPQRRLEHYRDMVRLLMEKYRVKSYRGGGRITPDLLADLCMAMLPHIVPALQPANVDENGMPIRSGGRPRLITPRLIATIREKVKQGVSVRAACMSLSGGNVKQARALAARYHRAMGSQ
jgi:hypothetical protein